jgi:plasmid maintenance system antidote protein VapI
MSSHEAKSQAKQDSDNALGLLRLFLDTHHLSLEELAGLLRITPQTLEEWFNEGMAPPASCLALAVLFDTSRQVSVG